MALVLSLAALFLSTFLLQLGLGGVVPLDAFSGVSLGFSKAEIGLLGSAHFLGFFVGCWWAPRLMGAVGNARAFAAMTALGTIAVMAHVLVQTPAAWTVMRAMVGLAVAGCYTVIESWMQSKLTRDTRGRAMAIYRVVDISGSLGAQMLIGFLTPASYISYNILALICCATLFPLLLTRAEAPVTRTAPRLRPAIVWQVSPLSAVAVVVSGVTGSAFRMVGPVYALSLGLDTDTTAAFLSLYILGGAVAQFPAGWLADHFERRWVLIGLGVAALAASGLSIAVQGAGPGAIIAASAVFGLATMPLYSVASAHAHDFVEEDQRVELSAAILFLYAIGAMASPWVASLLIGGLGPAGMFGLIGLANIGLVLFGLARLAVRREPRRHAGYIYMPRTSVLVGRLLRRNREP